MCLGKRRLGEGDEVVREAIDCSKMDERKSAVCIIRCGVH